MSLNFILLFLDTSTTIIYAPKIVQISTSYNSKDGAMTMDVLIVSSSKDIQIRTPKNVPGMYIYITSLREKIRTFYSNVRLHSKHSTTVGNMLNI